MPQLYTMPGTCALAPNIAVAWLDAPVEIVNLDRGENLSAAYLDINPQGKVPALTFEDGDVLTEATAILAWLGAEYGSGRYARDTTLGRREAEALSYMTSEVHAAFGPVFAPQRYADGEAAQAEAKRHAHDAIAAHYVRLDAALTQHGGEWYLGERSFADAYLYVLVRWMGLTLVTPEEHPALAGHRGRMESDAGVLKALARQGMAPLG